MTETTQPEAPPTHASAPHRRRVLTVSADMGGGHNATAAALEETVLELWPGSEIRRVDALDVMGSWVGRVFRAIYVVNVERTPWLYEFFYSALWRHGWFARSCKRFTGSWCGRRLSSRIDQFDPDLIISTYPLGTAGLAWLRRHRGLAVRCGAWVSDFSPHPFWVYRDVDLNLVMHEAAVPVARAAEPGLPIEVCAPPVVGRFAPGDRREARRRLGLREDAFIVLVSSGAYAFGDTEATVRALLEASLEVQVVTACAHDDDLRERLTQLHVPRGQLVPLGWTDDMPSYMQAADVVVTNAGGATALEALASGRPVLMSRPIAAHGVANAELMTVAGLAEVCADERQLVDRIRTSASAPRTLAEQARRSAEHVAGHDLAGGLTRLAEPDRGPVGDTPARRPWPMRPADAFFTHVESENVRQELGAIIELGPTDSGGPLTIEALRREMVACAPGLPPMRRTLVREPALGWLSREAIDVGAHLHERVVAPEATEQEVLAAVADFWSEPIRSDIPSWEMLLVSGLAGGRTTMAVKMHHAQGDGVSALGLLDRLLNASADDDLRERGPSVQPVRPTPARTVRRSARRTLSAGARQVTLTGRGLWSLATRGRPARHAMNARPVGARRQVVTVAVTQDELRESARAYGAHPHELFLAVLADALGRALGPSGLAETDLPVRTMVPIAMRPPRLDRIFGNWTGSVALDLPLDPTMSTADRVNAVRSELRRRVRRGEPQAAQLVMVLAGRLPDRIHGMLARLVYNRRFFSTIVSYMPGPRLARWCADAPVLATFPVLPLAEGVPVTAGMVVAGGTAGIGVVLDASLGLAPPEVTNALRNAFTDAVSDARRSGRAHTATADAHGRAG